MTPRTVKIVCAEAPRHIVYVPAVRLTSTTTGASVKERWRCSWCGARVRVVA